MELYINRNGEQFGPYSEEVVRTKLAAGIFQLTDFAWYEGADDWMPLSAVPGFARRSTPPPLRPAALRATQRVDLPEISRHTLGSYASSTLQPNETPLYKTSIHWIIFVGPSILAFFVIVIFALVIPLAIRVGSWSVAGWLALIALLLLVFIVLPAYVTYLTSELVITNRRVLIKVGFIRRRTLEMFISKIESVGVSQGLFGRFYDYGTVKITGTGGSAEWFNTIAHPLEFRNCIQRIQSQTEAR
jgi:membrane protein YdbS with pleckstrin-like domain